MKPERLGTQTYACMLARLRNMEPYGKTPASNLTNPVLSRTQVTKLEGIIKTWAFHCQKGSRLPPARLEQPY